MTIDDKELLERSRQGDKAAFEELVRRHYAPLQRFIYRYKGMNYYDDETREALSHEIAEKALYKARDNKRAKYDPAKSKFTTWIHKRAIWIILDEFRKSKREELAISRLGYATDRLKEEDPPITAKPKEREGFTKSLLREEETPSFHRPNARHFSFRPPDERDKKYVPENREEKIRRFDYEGLEKSIKELLRLAFESGVLELSGGRGLPNWMFDGAAQCYWNFDRVKLARGERNILQLAVHLPKKEIVRKLRMNSRSFDKAICILKKKLRVNGNILESDNV